MPIDKTYNITMRDANGGKGELNGFVRDVNLTAGSIFTTTSLHVGQTVPFDLLLGRPWQQGNYVSIVERKSGTYLLFNDPDTDEVHHELCAISRMRPTSHEVAYFPIRVYSAFTGRDSPTDWNQDEREAAEALVRLRNPIPLT